ncbi:uncharacterized protein C5orf47 homolog isoform X2 [Hemicordylus capensis]|nr:uncharacterized protein C5orf47 homolog isoform X2 [Hemicordylus capensis]
MSCGLTQSTPQPPPGVLFSGSAQVLLCWLHEERERLAPFLTCGACIVSMKPNSHPQFGRERFRIVYVNRFGNHRCGTVIHYGGLRQREALKDTHSYHRDKAVSTISDRIDSAGAAHNSHGGGRSPCLMLGATSRMGAKEAGVYSNQALNKSNEAKESKSRKIPKARKVGTETPSSLKEAWSRKNVSMSSTAHSSQKQTGDNQETQGDSFEFPSSLENDNDVIQKKQQKKKSAVWLGVSKVISKMVEENEHFRSRLMMSHSQLLSEG